MSFERFALSVRQLMGRQPVDWFGEFARINGEAVHYVDLGCGAPVLLIHGFFAWSFTWRENLPVLAREFRCLAPDLRGWGLSQRHPKGQISLGAQADLLAGLMDHLGLKRAVLVGHSMGGEVALRFALHHPDRLQGLVLVAPSALVRRRRMAAERYLLRLPIIAPLFVRGAVLNRRFAVRSLRGGYFHQERVTDDAISGYHLPARLSGSARTFLAVLRDADFGAAAARIHQVQHRTLIIWGENDPWVPLAHGERLTAELPNSRLVVFPECGHLPHEEYPERFHEEVLPFLRSLWER